MVHLIEHFRSDKSSRHSDWLRQQKWFIKAREDRARTKKQEERLEQDLDTLATAFVAASEEAIQIFETKLNTYDQATVFALMENQALLDEVQARLDTMLDRAHVLDDGRRVFKSRDGSFVIDEYGEQVTAQEIDPMIIPDSKPSAEDYLSAFEAKQELMAEREKLLEFQDKIDNAREKIADGEISESDLENLDAELLDAMPASVRSHVPEMAALDNVPNLKSEFLPSANPIQSRTINTPILEPNLPG